MTSMGDLEGLIRFHDRTILVPNFGHLLIKDEDDLETGSKVPNSRLTGIKICGKDGG